MRRHLYLTRETGEGDHEVVEGALSERLKSPFTTLRNGLFTM
jgi:hypothetical protein